MADVAGELNPLKYNYHRTIRIKRTTGPGTFGNFFGADWDDKSLLGRITKRKDIHDDVNLICTEDTIEIPIKNTYTKPFEEYVSKALSSTLGSLAQFTEFLSSSSEGHDNKIDPWIRHAQAWSSTEPISLTLNFNFRIGQFGLWNAFQEVYMPIMSLLIPSLPKELNKGTITGPYPSPNKLLMNSITGAFSSDEGFVNSVSAGVLNAGKANAYNIILGTRTLLTHSICTQGSYNLSTEVDTKGWPIHGTVRLVMQGIMPPALINNVV